MKGWCSATSVIAALIAVTLFCATAAADEPKSPEELFQEGVAALLRGDHGRSVAVFEALADRGVVHPDVSYNRGMAYLARVRAKQGQPGDLGRAAAGFEEALIMRSGDEGALRALDVVRAEVARTGPKTSRSDVNVSPSLDRIIVGLTSESIWAWCAVAGSLLLSIGLVLRRRKAGAAHLVGAMAVPMGLLGLLLFGSAAGWSRHLRQTTRPAVVVVGEARVLDEHGSALPREQPIPEAARVEVLERRNELAKIRYGQREGWTHRASLRELGGGS